MICVTIKLHPQENVMHIFPCFVLFLADQDGSNNGGHIGIGNTNSLFVCLFVFEGECYIFGDSFDTAAGVFLYNSDSILEKPKIKCTIFLNSMFN